jgi:exonuclease SbcC
MRLHRLRLVHFRQHRETDVEFGPGLTAIIGPNGAGKSTLLEAIAWAIYGMDAARGNRESLRWRRARPRAEVRVELEFGLGAHEYRVTRTLFDAALYLDGGARPIVTALRDVSARLTRVLGMTREEFFHTYFTGQKELALMAAMRPTERGQFLSRLLGYDKLRLGQDAVRGRRSTMNAELAALQQNFPDPAALAAEQEARAARLAETDAALAAAEAALAAAQAASDQHLPVFRDLTGFRERYAVLTADRRIAEERVRQAVELVARLERQHAAAETARTELVRLAPALAALAEERAALAALDALAREAEERARLETQCEEVARQAQEIGERLAAARAAADGREAAAAALAAARAELEAAERAQDEGQAAWVREKADADATRRSLLEQYQDLETQRDRIVAAGEGGACPTCGRALGGEYASVLELLETQLAEVKANGLYYRSRIEQLQAMPPELTALEERRRALVPVVEQQAQALAMAERSATEAAALETQAARLAQRRTALDEGIAARRSGYDRERHEAVRRRVAELEPAAARAQRLAADAERVAAVAAELQAAEARRAAQVEALAGFERELTGLAFSEEQWQAASREMERLERAWREADRSVAVARAERGAAEDALREAERRAAEASARALRVGHLRGEVRLHGELDRALGDLRTELNQEMRPELAAIAGDLLASLTDGTYDEIMLDAQYNATVMEDGVPQPVISGGEEDLTNLVLRLAVSQMIAERAGQPLSLLVLDEIFGSLDEVRRAGVLRLLRGLAGRFPQAVLITHVEGVRDSVDRVLRVAYDESTGASTVAEERLLPLLPGAGGEDVAA